MVIGSPGPTGAAAGSCRERIRSTCFWLSGRCANSASVGRMPATRRARCRFRASGAFGPVVSSTPRIDHSAREMSVLRRSRRTRPCACASASSPAISSRAVCDEMVIGDPQPGQAAEMLRLKGARLLEEVLESRAVGPRRRGPGQGDGRLEDVRDQGLDEGLLGGEVAVERAHADARRGGHIGHAGFEPLLLEDLTGRSEQTLPVLQGVAAHRSDGRRGRPAPRLRLARIRRFHSAYPSGQSGAVGPLVPLFLGGAPVSLTVRSPVSPQWSPRAWTPPTRPRAPGPASWRRCSRDGCRRNR